MNSAIKSSVLVVINSVFISIGLVYLLQESDVTPYDYSFPVNVCPPPLCELPVNSAGGNCEIVYISGFKERPTQVAQFFYLEYPTNFTLRLFGHS
jgi:hypothetical protein